MATYQDIVESIRKRSFSPLYMLAGEEPYYIDQLTDLMEKKVIPQDEWDFNRIVLYGNDIKVADIVNASRLFPMMGDRQIVIVKEAQLVGDIESLSDYYGTFPDTTILVIAYKKKPDKRKALFAKAEKMGLFFVSEQIRDYRMPDFILSVAAAKKLIISPEVAHLLADHIGNDLEKLMNELDKLVLVTKATSCLVTPELVELHIGISKTYNIFELLRAVVQKDIGKAFQIAQHFGRNEKEHPIQATLPVLFNFFSNLMIVFYLPRRSKDDIIKALGISGFQAKDYITGVQMYAPKKVYDIIHEIRMTDARSKGIDASGSFAQSGDLLLELLHFIFH